MDLILGAALAFGAIVVVIGTYFLLAAGLWDLLKRLLRLVGLLRPPAKPATAEEMAEVKQLLEEIKAGSTPEGATDIGTDALAAHPGGQAHGEPGFATRRRAEDQDDGFPDRHDAVL